MVVVEKLRDEALDMLVWAFEVRLRCREVELASAKVEVVDLTCYFGWTSFQVELVETEAVEDMSDWVEVGADW